MCKFGCFYREVYAVRNEGKYEADMNYEDDARWWIVIPIYQLCYTGDIKMLYRGYKDQ